MVFVFRPLWITALLASLCVSGRLQADDPGTCPTAAPAISCSTSIADSFISSDPSHLQNYTCGEPYAPLDQTGPDHQYSFECQVDGDVTLRLTEQDCDIDIYVLDDSCDPDQGCLAGETSVTSDDKLLSFNCIAGQDYIVSIEAFGFLEIAQNSCTDVANYTLTVAGGSACPEDCDDGIDNDLDGLIDCDDPNCSDDPICPVCDNDGDGYDGVFCGGSDCNDEDSGINPSATEVCGNGVDEDCDGFGLFTDDEDADGCTTEVEQALASPTDACAADSDNDTLIDGLELGGDCAFGAGETDPLDADSDDDGLADGEEDVNANGVVDAGETDPLDADSDTDTLSDGLESGKGSGVPAGTSSGTGVAYSGTDSGWVPDSDPTSTTDPLETDTDGDRLLDNEEDADGDGAVDGTETDPAAYDTDADGYDDYIELVCGWDPTNALDPGDDNDCIVFSDTFEVIL